MLMMPESIVLATAFVIFLVDLFVSERHRSILAPLALVGLILTGISIVWLIPQEGTLLGGRFAVDSVTESFKLLFVLSALGTIALSFDLLEGRALSSFKNTARGEYYTLLLFTVAGMMFLVSARDLVTLYVSLELSTIPLYLLSAWRRDRSAGEAGMKYLVLGALTSALFLYGLGLLYGLTGATDFETLHRSLQPSPAFWLAMALMLAGVGFKLTLVPFHFWAADVYQGAPSPIAAYLSVASKAAGLVLMFQIFFHLMGRFLGDLALFVAILAALTMTLGNLAALTQRNIKRFMAFSAISQAGYLIIGFISPSAANVPAMIFYLLVYIVTNLAVFTVIVFFCNETGREDIRDYRGLSRTHPFIALGMMIALFGLAGIPPLAGFVGKFFLFSIAAKAGYHWLVAVAAINSTVSLYYYLRIVRQIYIEPVSEKIKTPRISPALGVALGVFVSASVLLGIVPTFYEYIHTHTWRWFTLWIQ